MKPLDPSEIRRLFHVGRFEKAAKNSLTDIAGVRVGHVTLIRGEGDLKPGEGPVRTGVTVILPNDDIWRRKYYAGSYVMNGNGEACGLMWLQESGLIESPIAFTNTLSVSEVHKGITLWMLEKYREIGVTDDSFIPMVLECDDSTLNDIRGMHVTAEDTSRALSAASSESVPEGAVGAGTGMITYELKGGIGTSSRLVPIGDNVYTVAVMLNSNHGKRHNLTINGQAVGGKLSAPKPGRYKDGSIVICVATDAPLESRQLSRLAKRAMIGVSRTGGISYHSSGDVVVSFSTANVIPHKPAEPLCRPTILSDHFLDDLFEAASDACEEALIRSMLCAETVRGRDGITAHALDHGELMSLLQANQ